MGSKWDAGWADFFSVKFESRIIKRYYGNEKRDTGFSLNNKRDPGSEPPNETPYIDINYLFLSLGGSDGGDMISDTGTDAGSAILSPPSLCDGVCGGWLFILPCSSYESKDISLKKIETVLITI